MLDAQRSGWGMFNRPQRGFALNLSSTQAQGLMGWWPIPRDTGTHETVQAGLPAVLDYSGHQAHGLSVGNANGIDRTVPIYGRVLSRIFAADLTYDITVQALADLPTTYNFTLSVWASNTAFAVESVMSISGTDDLILVPYDNSGGNGPRIFWRNLGGSIIKVTGGVPAVDGDMHLFTFVSRASNDHHLFVDGLEVGSSSATGSAGPFSAVGLMGFEAGQSYNGNACDFRLYSRALTDAEIWGLYDPRTRWDLYGLDQSRLWGKTTAVAPDFWLGQTTYQPGAPPMTPGGLIPPCAEAPEEIV